MFLQRVLETDFAKDKYTDFEIICGSRTFHVHQVILREHDYFRAAIEGNFQEAASMTLDLAGEDVVMVECILMHIYGATWQLVSKQCAQVDAATATLLQDLYGEKYDKAMDLFRKDPDAYYYFAYDDECLLSLICYELKRHVLLYKAADSFLVPKLKDMIINTLGSKIAMAWNAPEVLEVIKAAYKAAPVSDKGLRNLFIGGIDQQLNALLKEDKFQHMLDTVDGLAADVLRKSAHRPREPHLIAYCTACLKNTEIVEPKRKPNHCSECKSVDLEERKDEIWTNQDKKRKYELFKEEDE